MILTSLSLVLTVAAAAPGAPANPYVRGLEAPARRIVRTIGTTPDVTPPASIVRRCDAYPAHAVLWTENPALMGVLDVELRARPVGLSPEQVCAPSTSAGRRFKESDGVYDPVGAIDRYLVTLYPDGIGVLSSFQVIDMDTGTRLLDEQFNVTKGLDFSRAAGGVTLSWWTRLDDVPCVPRRGEGACWQRILAARKVPAGVQIPQPDCEPLVKRIPSVVEKPYGIIQITVHARATLGKPGVEFFADPATCDESE